MSGFESLGASGRALWDSIHEVRDVRSEFVPILLNACRIVDRLDDISADLVGSSLTAYNAKGDPVANPLVGEHRMQLGALTSALKSLGIDKLPEAEDTGPSFEEKLAAAGDELARRRAK